MSCSPSSREFSAEKKRTEGAVCQEEPYRVLAESIPQLVWMARGDGAVEYVNRRWMEYTGLSLREALDFQWERAVHPEDLPLVREVWVDSLRTGAPYEVKGRLRSGDGAYRWYLARALPLRNEHTEIVRWFGTCTDIEDQIRAEAALRASEFHFRAIIEKSFDCIDLVSADGTILYSSPSAGRILGYTPEEDHGRNAFELLHPDDQLRVREQFERLVRTPGGYETSLHRGRHRDGSYRWLEARATNLLDDPWVAAVVINFRDVTEQRRAEEARQKLASQHNELLRRLQLQIERMPLGYILFDQALRITEWNHAAERIFGFSREEVLGMGPPYQKIVPPSGREQVEEVLPRLRSGDRSVQTIHENLTRDGHLIHCEWFHTPLRSPAGAFEGILSMVLDVTDRVRTAEALRLRDRAIQAVPQGIVITDASGPENPIVFVSPGFEHMTGYTQEETLGRNPRFLQGPETDQATLAQLREAVHAGRPCSVEILNYRKDGTPFWNALSISPIRDEAGKLTHFVAVKTDVTERRRLEEQLRQSQRLEAIGQLAGGVAHDFNNLLCIINGYAELLLQSLPQGDPNRSLLDEIRKAGERSATLTRQLLAFSRKQVLAPKVLDLNEVVRDTEKMLRRIIGEDIRLHTALDDSLGKVRADRGQLEQVLLNLAVNARDAMPQGGRLTIETKNVTLDQGYVQAHAEVRTGSYVLLAVSDTGSGMTPEVKARLFEPFFTTKGLGKGTGLGLATVYGIVKQSAGHIQVYSEVGIGTSFKVYLPRLQESVAAGKSNHDLLVAPRGTETVLLVEDDDAVRALTRRVLQDRGYTVLAASYGSEAVRLAERHQGPIQLLVSDVVMPGMGGRQVAEHVLTMHPEMKLLYLSGYTDDAVVRHGILEEQVNFLQKPFSPMMLAQKVREVLDLP